MTEIKDYEIFFMFNSLTFLPILFSLSMLSRVAELVKAPETSEEGVGGRERGFESERW